MLLNSHQVCLKYMSWVCAIAFMIFLFSFPFPFSFSPFPEWQGLAWEGIVCDWCEAIVDKVGTFTPGCSLDSSRDKQHVFKYYHSLSSFRTCIYVCLFRKHLSSAKSNFASYCSPAMIGPVVGKTCAGFLKGGCHWNLEHVWEGTGHANFKSSFVCRRGWLLDNGHSKFIPGILIFLTTC